MSAGARDWGRTGYSLAAIRDLARSTLPRAVFDFADGGAEDEQSLRRNEATFANHDLLPRPLNGVGDRDVGRVFAPACSIYPTGRRVNLSTRQNVYRLERAVAPTCIQ